MSGEPRKKRSRRRGRRNKPRSEALTPLTKKKQLDLEQPTEKPLSEAELAEAKDHLGFLKRYKGVLRLKLNSAEDLLVNGARAPQDRGVLKHLFKKIDRSAVEQAITREPLKSSAKDRVRFLGGAVRLDPAFSTLLGYLEALTEITERREAARALDLTVKRVSFAEASEAQMAQLVDLVTRTFEGHDLTQALLGLLRSRSFSEKLDQLLPRLDGDTQMLLGCLAAAERVLLRGEPPPSDEPSRVRLDAGVKRLLDAPDQVLKSYSESVRRRLAEYALDRDPLGKSVRVLLDSLPHKSPEYAALGLVWSQRLLADGHDDRAKGILEQVVQGHPKHAEARERLEALAWPKHGRVTLMPGTPRANVRVERAFWLDGSAFVWVRRGRPADAARFAAEAKLQTGLYLPGVLPALGAGKAKDGAPYVIVRRRGKPLAGEAPPRLALALERAREGLTILKALALAGVELPDADPRRFALVGRASLVLFDFDGAKEATPQQVEIAHAPIAFAFCQRMLADQADLPPELVALTRRRKPLPVMLEVIERWAARLTSR